MARNVLWSLAGAGLPLLVGLWAIPELISGLGKERFGLLAIVWMAIGYFSLFDLGIGRALTKLVAECLGRGLQRALPRIVSVGSRLMLILGVASAGLTAALTPVIIFHILDVPEALVSESLWAFLILSATIVAVIQSAGLIGVLQAYQDFRSIALIRIPLGVVTFLGPVAVLPFSESLVATVSSLAAARCLAWLFYYARVRRHVRTLPPRSTVRRDPFAKKLLGFGGWISVSNVVGPMMVYFDRLLIGAVFGLTAVTYYTTPFEMVTRLWVFSITLSDVLFPALTAALVSNIERARVIYGVAINAQVVFLLPLIAVVMLFAPEGLNAWLGGDFSSESTEVLRWLALGVYINSFARLPFTLLQGAGRPDLTAKVHLVELPLYCVVLWFLVHAYGIEGAAMAWTLRISVDTSVLSLLAPRRVPELRGPQQGMLVIVAISCALLWPSFALSEPFSRGALLAVILVVSGIVAWGILRRGGIFQMVRA